MSAGHFLAKLIHSFWYVQDGQAGSEGTKLRDELKQQVLNLEAYKMKSELDLEAMRTNLTQITSERDELQKTATKLEVDRALLAKQREELTSQYDAMCQERSELVR